MNQTKQGLSIKLDTNNKTITLQNTTNLKELTNSLKKLLPKDSPFGSWEEYSIEINPVYTYYPPIQYTYVDYTVPIDWQVINHPPSTCDLNNDGSFTISNYTLNSEIPKEAGIYYLQI